MSNSEVISKLQSATKENIERLQLEGTICKDSQVGKSYVSNKTLEYNSGGGKKSPVTIGVLYHALYDPESQCQLSKGKKSFTDYMLEKQNDYDINFTKPDIESSSLPSFFKKSLPDSALFFNNINSNKKDLEELGEYPKVMNFKYVYKHPIPKPVFMGPKLLDTDNRYKIAFISPICLLVEITTYSSGFKGVEDFYTCCRYKFESELNSDLSLKKTTMDINFGINFIKETWLKSTIEKMGYSQAEEGIVTQFVPTVVKELELSMKKFTQGKSGGGDIISKLNSSFLSMDTVSNDSFISEIDTSPDTPAPTVFKSGAGKFGSFGGEGGVVEMVKNNLFPILIVLGITNLLYFVGKIVNEKYTLCLAAGIMMYLLVQINNKMNKLTNEK